MYTIILLNIKHVWTFMQCYLTQHNCEHFTDICWFPWCINIGAGLCGWVWEGPNEILLNPHHPFWNIVPPNEIYSNTLSCCRQTRKLFSMQIQKYKCKNQSLPIHWLTDKVSWNVRTVYRDVYYAFDHVHEALGRVC